MAGRSAILAFVAMLALGLAGGVWSAYRVLASGAAPGSSAYGPWIAWHRAGAPDADPYSLAATARRGDIPMALGEGLAFFASRDGDDGLLWTGCDYEVAGAFPPARAWTLTLYRTDGRLIAGPSGRSAFTSAEALTESERVAVRLSPRPQPGNWLPLPADGRFVLALRFYDTPLSAVAAALDARRLPSLRRLGCGP